MMPSPGRACCNYPPVRNATRRIARPSVYTPAATADESPGATGNAASRRRNSINGSSSLCRRSGAVRSTKHHDAGRDRSGKSRTRRPLRKSASISGKRPSAIPAPPIAAPSTWLKPL